MCSFEEQVHRYQDRVFGFACHLLHNRAAAADVTQDVLIRFWEHRATLDPNRVLPWLMRVTRNACIDAMRRRSTRRDVFGGASEAVRRAPCHRPSPQADAEASDFQGHLERALAQLDEPYRSIVILREVQDLKYKEISATLDLPLNTVKVYLHRGRKQLRNRLAEHIDYEVA